MAKDAGGHGSEAGRGHGSDGRGGGDARAAYRAKTKAGLDRAEKFGVRQRELVAGGMKPMDAFNKAHSEMNGDKAAAATLASGPKSASVPVHPGASGRAEGISAETRAWQNFHASRPIKGPFYLDPHDPRAKR